MAGKKIKKKKKVLKPEEVETLTEQLINSLKAHARWVVVACGMFLVLSALTWAYVRYTKNRNEQAAYAYYISVKNYKSADDAVLEQNIQKFLKNYPGHPLTKIATLDEVALMAKEGKWDEVIKNCEKLLTNTKQNNPLYPIILKHLAKAYTAKGNWAKALNLWEQLEKVCPPEWTREIYWNEALILEKTNKKKEALEKFENALITNGFLPDDFTIKLHMNRLKLQLAAK